MSGLFGFGGSASKTDRGNQLTSFGSLSDTAHFGTKSGEGGITAAQDYFQSLLSGDPTKIAGAIGPQASIIKGQAQQQKQQLAEFGTRSGGTAGAASMIDANTQGAIQNLINTLIPQAATQAGNLGLSTLSTGANSAAELGSLATTARSTDLQNESQMGGGIFSLFKNAADLIPGGAGDILGTLLAGV